MNQRENRLSRAWSACKETITAYRELWKSATVAVDQVLNNDALREFRANVLLDGQVIETATVTLTKIEGWGDMTFVLLAPPADQPLPTPAMMSWQDHQDRGMMNYLQGIHREELMRCLREAFRVQGIELQSVTYREGDRSGYQSHR